MINKLLGFLLVFTILLGFYSETATGQKTHNKTAGQKNSVGSGYAKTNWTVTDPFEQKVFIENNEGQFDGKASPDGNKVLFMTRINEVYLYFTPAGVTYRYDEYPKVNQDGEKDEDKKEKDIKPESHFFSVNWVGANQSTDVIAKEQVSFYYTYSKGSHAIMGMLLKNCSIKIFIQE